MVFAPGETLRFEVLGHLLPVAAETPVQIEVQLLDSQQRQLWSTAQEVRAGSERPIPVEITLPQDEGVYDVAISAQQNSAWPRALRQSLRWKRSIAQRRLQLVVIARQPPAEPAARELSPVAEIDPAVSRWWQKVKLPRLPRFSRGLGGSWGGGIIGPLGNGMRTTIHHALGEISQLKAAAAGSDASWEAYPLTIGVCGKPYVLEIEYPSDVPQSLGLSVVETNAAGLLAPIALDSSVEVSVSGANASPDATPHWERHRLVFWPRTSTPLALVSNRGQRSPAVYGKIRVLGGWERLPREAAGRPGRAARLIAAYMDRPLLTENFSADEVPDALGGTLHDWKTFHQAGTRLVDYLRYAGYNGLVLAVAADGSAIYPSQVLEPTPRYDTGALFSSGQDPMPKDVLEMLMRLMDREDLQLIPAIEFAAPLPVLEAIRRRGGHEAQGLEWIGADAAPRGFRPVRSAAAWRPTTTPSIRGSRRRCWR